MERVERSHREDEKEQEEKYLGSEKELKTPVKKHMQIYNSTAKTSIGFLKVLTK